MQMHLVDLLTYLLAIPVSICSSHTISLENATSYRELSAFSTREAILSLFLILLTFTMSLIVDTPSQDHNHEVITLVSK